MYEKIKTGFTEDYGILGCDAVSSGKYVPEFRGTLPPPHSG